MAIRAMHQCLRSGCDNPPGIVAGGLLPCMRIDVAQLRARCCGKYAYTVYEDFSARRRHDAVGPAAVERRVRCVLRHMHTSMVHTVPPVLSDVRLRTSTHPPTAGAHSKHVDMCLPASVPLLAQTSPAFPLLPREATLWRHTRN